ncbi:MAG: c-type cytochrome domain-containing protein, partial [Planctomycetota bacterium]
MALFCRLLAIALAFGVSLALASPQDPVRTSAAAPVDFARDVRPILADNCYRCHGFDPQVRKGGLRLDQQDGALAELPSGAYAVRPGDADGSELVRRILATDAGDRMPPPDSEITLEPDEIRTLVR